MRHILLMLVCAAMFSGCSLTRDQLPLNCNVNAPAVQSFASKPTDGISVGNIVDKRGMEDPRVLFKKRNAYGHATSGIWEADKPVAAIVSDAIRNGLARANFNSVPNGGEYLLYGNLLDLRHEAVSGWQGEIRAAATVQLYLKDTRSGRVVWNEIFMARGVAKGHTPSELVRMGLNSTLDDLAKQVAESDALRSNFIHAMK